MNYLTSSFLSKIITFFLKISFLAIAGAITLWMLVVVGLSAMIVATMLAVGAIFKDILAIR